MTFDYEGYQNDNDDISAHNYALEKRNPAMGVSVGSQPFFLSDAVVDQH